MKHTTKTIEGQCSGAERRPCFSKDGPPNGGCHKGTPIGTSASPVKTPVRTAKHKKYKLKECRVVVEDIFKNLHSHPNTETIQKSNLCDLKLDDIFSSDSFSSEIHSIKSSESKTLNSSEDIVNIMETCGDGKSKGISRCSSARCGFKDKYFVPRDRVFSTVTHRTYDVIIAPGEKNVNCHSSNCIYLMTCNNCNLQYVGETVQKLNIRQAKHTAGFVHPSKQTSCKILTNHFTEGICKGAGHTVQIIEKLEGMVVVVILWILLLLN